MFNAVLPIFVLHFTSVFSKNIRVVTRIFNSFPVLSLDPVVGAIAAGNALVLKPSEIAPATSSLLAKLVSEYMDSSSIRVVEGAVTETSALLEQKWDKIFYTGSYHFCLLTLLWA